MNLTPHSGYIAPYDYINYVTFDNCIEYTEGLRHNNAVMLIILFLLLLYVIKNELNKLNSKKKI